MLNQRWHICLPQSSGLHYSHKFIQGRSQILQGTVKLSQTSDKIASETFQQIFIVLQHQSFGTAWWCVHKKQVEKRTSSKNHHNTSILLSFKKQNHNHIRHILDIL